MNSRERMLAALSNETPDRLPCQVHGWMGYYLDRYLDGIDEWTAFDKFGMDFAIYVSPQYIYSEQSQANWRRERTARPDGPDGSHHWEETITTPGGTLHHSAGNNEITEWETEYLIKTEADFELFERYYPIPSEIDFMPIQLVKDRLGDRGIIRSHPWGYGQGSPWQMFCVMHNTEEAILLGMDSPELLSNYMEVICQKMEKVMTMWEGIPSDMVEVGGGSGSSTVISPNFYRKFGLPYDQRLNKLYHNANIKVVNHFCGGLMPMLNLVVESGADGLETMTPPSMGGDCDLAEASRRVGDKLFFIGGFDQNEGFNTKSPATVRRMVHECFDSTKDHAGYICSPSDHFFSGDPENIRIFAEACRECEY